MIKITHLFSGIGGPEEGIKGLPIDFEVVNYCEIEDFASKSYSIIHNVSEERNLGDVSKVNETKLDDFDLLIYGFPCQDISIIGEQKGIIGGVTRSGLLYDALRIGKYKKPKYMIAENVKNLIGENFIGDFRVLLRELSDMGYNNYYQVLNSLNYGLPQNRERIFIVSIRKDLDQGFFFPRPYNGIPRLREFLELGQPLNYDYYLTEDNIKGYIFKSGDFGERLHIKNPYKEYAYCLTTKSAKAVITNNYVLDIHGIRGLTERECFKIQGFNPDYVDLLKENGITKNQLYSMVGNSISSTVFKEILRNLLIEKTTEKQLSLF